MLFICNYFYTRSNVIERLPVAQEKTCPTTRWRIRVQAAVFESEAVFSAVSCTNTHFTGPLTSKMLPCYIGITKQLNNYHHHHLSVLVGKEGIFI